MAKAVEPCLKSWWKSTSTTSAPCPVTHRQSWGLTTQRKSGALSSTCQLWSLTPCYFCCRMAATVAAFCLTFLKIWSDLLVCSCLYGSCARCGWLGESILLTRSSSGPPIAVMSGCLLVWWTQVGSSLDFCLMLHFLIVFTDLGLGILRLD